MKNINIAEIINDENKLSKRAKTLCNSGFFNLTYSYIKVEKRGTKLIIRMTISAKTTIAPNISA